MIAMVVIAMVVIMMVVIMMVVIMRFSTMVVIATTTGSVCVVMQSPCVEDTHLN